MVGKSKIEKYELEEEVLDLRRAGYNYRDIVDTLKTNHPDIADLKKLSAMSLSRFFEKTKVDNALSDIKDGIDPIEEIKATFRDKMFELDEQTIEICDIMRKSLKRMVREGDDFKIIKAAKDTLTSLEQTRRNWSTLMQQCMYDTKPVEKAEQINRAEVMTLLFKVSREICPKCRPKVVEIITKETEKGV